MTRFAAALVFGLSLAGCAAAPRDPATDPWAGVLDGGGRRPAAFVCRPAPGYRVRDGRALCEEVAR